FPLYGGNEIHVEDNQVHTELRDAAASIPRNYQIITSRGCPFSCTYCLHGKIRELYPGQKYLRRRSVENVIAELEQRSSQGFFTPFLPFYDEVFARDKKWIEEFARQYGRRIALPFTGYAHESLSTFEMLRSLQEAGMTSAALSFQSGSERICRDIYKRRNNYDRLVELAQRIHETKLFEIMVFEGLTNSPFETEEDCRATLEFLLRLPTPFYLQICKLAIFPGTKIEKMPRPENALDEGSFRFWNMLYLLTQSQHLSRDTIRSLVDDSHLRANPGL
ncbi:unnamed protein product, partial [marine sediment metagenome]